MNPLGLAQAALKAGQAERALSLAHLAVALAPDEPANHDVLARSALKARRYDLSETRIDRLLDLAPDEPRYMTLKAIDITRRRDHEHLDDAAAMIGRARALSPGMTDYDGILDEIERMRAYLRLDHAYRRAPRSTMSIVNRVPPARDDLSHHIADRILSARARAEPFSHFFVAEIFPDEVYAQMHHRRPPAAATGAGTYYKDRKSAALDVLAQIDPAAAGFWRTTIEAINAPVVLDAFLRALNAEPYASMARTNNLVLLPDVRLVCDQVGYALSPHKDHVSRFGSIIFNLPADDRDADLGTVIYARKDGRYEFDNGMHRPFANFEPLEKIPFRPNSAVGFLNFGEAYHGVEPIDRPVDRWSLQYTVRMDWVSAPTRS